MDLLNSVTGKIVGGIVAVAVVAAGISLWQMDPATRQQLASVSGRIASWFGVMLLLPWPTLFVTVWVARRQSNRAGAALVAGYTLFDAVLLAWLFNWSMAGATAWTFYAVGVLLASAYNLFACDWIAEKFE